MGEPYNSTASQVLDELKTDKDKGLSSQEAKARQGTYGLNQLREKKTKNPILLFLSQFRSFIIYILLFAVGISVLTAEYVDAAVILFILLFNAIFGFIQEYKTEKAIQALKKLAALKAKVIRD